MNEKAAKESNKHLRGDVLTAAEGFSGVGGAHGFYVLGPEDILIGALGCYRYEFV